MIESGIWRRLEKEQWARDSARREKKLMENEPQGADRVDMSGSIFTIFVLCGIVLGLSCVCFGTELRLQIFLQLSTTYDRLKYYISL